jgi:serine/threonine-protein kinase RsbW
MVRRLLKTALTIMGASEDCRADIAPAISEACANAVRHVHEAIEYRVIVTTSHDRCVVEVIDNGVGLISSERCRCARVPRACCGRRLPVPHERACRR